MFGKRRLVKHVIATIKVLDFDLCEVQCYHQPNCVSINFNVISDSKGFHECELSNGTHRSHHNELMNKDGYLYKGAEVRNLNLSLFFTETKERKRKKKEKHKEMKKKNLYPRVLAYVIVWQIYDRLGYERRFGSVLKLNF